MEEINKMTTQNQNRKFIITKKIAKHGSQAIIVIPRVLESQLKPGTLAEISINIIDEDEHNKINGGSGI
ncbi:Uncharacterised protein [uncultured archaeon]|nr:Uncharacterised protein [uncultured archaeon]